MYSCRAIIFDRKKILTGNKLKLFTDKLGKIEAYYKFNIKNINLDKLNLIKVNLKSYKDKIYLQNYIVENYFFKIRDNYEKAIIAMYLIELLDKTMDFDLPESKIFNMFISFLNFLSNEENQSKIFVNLIKFISYYFFFLGYGNLIENYKENYKKDISNVSFDEIIKLNEYIEKIFNIELNSLKINK